LEGLREATVADVVELDVRLDNTRPVEVSDLGNALHALGKQYEEFVVSHGFDQTPGNARLFVTHIETGSIIITLQSLLDQASFVLKHIEVFAGFVANLTELINFLFQQDKAPKPEPITREDVERISTILEPVAKDSGSQITIAVTGNTGPVTINPVIIRSEKANAVQNGARRFLGPSIPMQGNFERELMYLQQMRGDPKSKVGDRGVIEKFSPKPVKLHFMTPDVKASIVEQQENPFKMAYLVDGQVSTVEGKPALYKISAVHESFEQP
jgi:hypothetical protein